MRTLLIFAGAACISVSVFYSPLQGQNMAQEKKVFKPRSYQEADQKADSVLARMTEEEKISLLHGDRSFFIRPLPRLNLPEVYMTDATQGVHLRESFRNNDLSKYQLEKSTAFPCPIMLAAAWNTDLSYRYAEAVGEECRAGNIGVLLGPGMNSYRISQCGRNFEYFGEDPALRSKMIYAYVRGVQSTGTIATLKHFAANNTDYFRRKSNSMIDERTLHEIYLPPFKAGIEAGAQAVMTSYNLLNGEWCGQSAYVIHDLLRTQLGFRGLVMTDWWSVTDGEKLVKSGQDLEMPEANALKEIPKLLEDKTIAMKDIDRMAKSILRSCFIMRFDERQKASIHPEMFERHESIALQTAREGIVLLKNEEMILPLQRGQKKILLVGDYADKIVRGGGSAEVKGYNNRVLVDELKQEFGANLEYIRNPNPGSIRTADIVLCVIGTEDSEGWDRPFELPADQENIVKMSVENNPNTIVIVVSGSGVRMTGWSDKAKAILYTWYSGQNGSRAISEILSGKTNPSGKLPITIEKEFKDSPGYGYIPANETLYHGWNDTEEKTKPIYDIRYTEGVFTGYRWYEKKNIKPLFPFGFGLSYTSFEYSALSVDTVHFRDKGIVNVGVTIKNTGRMKGLETVQLYIQDIESSLPRPLKELKGFAKVELLPGESKAVEIQLGKNDFSYWNPETKGWFFEKGAFGIHVGPSSQDIRVQQQIDLY